VPAPPPPRSLSALILLRGTSGLPGRAVSGALLTVADTRHHAAARGDAQRYRTTADRFGGVIGGVVRRRFDDTLLLDGVVVVPGLPVSGSVAETGNAKPRLSGRVTGRLTVRGRRITGTVAGRRIRTRLPS